MARNLKKNQLLLPCPPKCKRICTGSLDEGLRKGILHSYWCKNFLHMRQWLDTHIKLCSVSCRTNSNQSDLEFKRKWISSYIQARSHRKGHGGALAPRNHFAPRISPLIMTLSPHSLLVDGSPVHLWNAFGPSMSSFCHAQHTHIAKNVRLRLAFL